MLKTIYIIESLVPKDKPIGQRLTNTLNRRGVTAHFRPVTNRIELDAALADVLAAMQVPGNSPVAVQLVCHGNAKGIGLTHDTLVEWETLRQQLRAIYVVTQSTFHLYMASCLGIAVVKLLGKKEPCPFTSLCGSGQPLRPVDAFDGLLHFYDRILKGDTPEAAAASTNISVGGFDMQAHDSIRLHDKALQNIRKPEMIQLFQDAAVERRRDLIDAGIISENALRAGFDRTAVETKGDEFDQTFKS